MRHCKDWLNDAMMIPWHWQVTPLAVDRNGAKLKIKKNKFQVVFRSSF